MADSTNSLSVSCLLHALISSLSIRPFSVNVHFITALVGVLCESKEALYFRP